MNKLSLNEGTKGLLIKARETYGDKNQILVSMEELNELACVLAKYPRYDDPTKATAELHDRVLDEVADVMIVLDHIVNIFSLSEKEIDNRIIKKVIRLKRWLDHSESMQETVDDRKVEDVEETKADKATSKCNTCVHRKEDPETRHNGSCSLCHQAQATEGISPFYQAEESK